MGLMLHWVPEAEERRDNRLPSVPCRVILPVIVVKLLASKVKVSGEETVLVKLAML
jgi:hypothetical protein